MVETSEEPSTRGDTVRRAVVVTVAVATVIGCIVATLLEPRPEVDVGASPDWLANLFVVGAAGLVVAWARPRNSIGWLLVTGCLPPDDLSGQRRIRPGLLRGRPA